MTIANVTLTNTFDEWRIRTNQLIALYDETNQLSRIAYNATNNFVSSTANLTANIIVANSVVYNTIYSNANTLTNTIVIQSFAGLYEASNASFAVANASLATANLTYNQANTARDEANIAVSFVIGYSSNTTNTVASYFDSMNVEATATRTIANLAYDTANNFLSNVSNSVAEVLAANTIIQNTVNASVTQLFVDYLANNDLTYVGAISNSAFSTANSAYDRANTAGGGYFAGNNGYTGNANNRADIFRINSNTFTGNIVFAAGENASATGPLYMDPSAMIEIQTGARVVIL